MEGNTRGGSGGGVFANGTTLTIQSSTLANNAASGNGGGIELDTTVTGSTLNDTTIPGNTAQNAGANGGGIDAGGGVAGTLKRGDDYVKAHSHYTARDSLWAGSCRAN